MVPVSRSTRASTGSDPPTVRSTKPLCPKQLGFHCDVTQIAPSLEKVFRRSLPDSSIFVGGATLQALLLMQKSCCASVRQIPSFVTSPMAGQAPGDQARLDEVDDADREDIPDTGDLCPHVPGPGRGLDGADGVREAGHRELIVIRHGFISAELNGGRSNYQSFGRTRTE